MSLSSFIPVGSVYTHSVTPACQSRDPPGSLHSPVIRRRVAYEFWLIAQDDHARLAGQLAGAFGNGYYAPPCQGEKTVLGVAMHDAGWPLHDDAPELNDQGLPSDVFETPVERGTAVWEASAARAEAADPYAGLLVSIHVQRLASRFDREPTALSNRERFWLIRFRNDQAQRQMRLRKALGLAVDRPLDHGLALAGDATAAADLGEQRLAHDVRILQAMDLLSLCICCTDPPASEIAPLTISPGGPSRPLRIERRGPSATFVGLWPFRPPALQLRVPYRPVPARTYESAHELRETLSQAPRRSFEVTLQPVPTGL